MQAAMDEEGDEQGDSKHSVERVEFLLASAFW